MGKVAIEAAIAIITDCLLPQSLSMMGRAFVSLMEHSDCSMIECEMRRIKVTLLKDVYKDLLDDIDKINKDIRDITNQNICQGLIRRQRHSKRPIVELKLIRKHATSLYEVLITGSGWQCRCKNGHIASLRLEPRPSNAGRGDSRFFLTISLPNSSIY